MGIQADNGRIQVDNRVFTSTSMAISMISNLGRWQELEADPRYTELAKQALNCLVAFLLATYQEKIGKRVNWTMFPRLAISRTFGKAYVYATTPEHRIHYIAEKSGIGKKVFDETAKEIISEEAESEFAEFLDIDDELFETRIYRAATKIATLVELSELESRQDVSEQRKQIDDTLIGFYDIQGVRELLDPRYPYFSLIKEFSALRNQMRWATFFVAKSTSDLEHLLDVAIWAYLMDLDRGLSETEASHSFFVGLFHDIPERWTGDIPSPIKDRIKGYREATEEFELQVIKEHIYDVLNDDFINAAIKDVMMEDEENHAIKSKMKAADYLAANRENWEQLIFGSLDPRVTNAILREIPGLSSGGKYLHDRFCQIARYIQTVNENMIP